MRNILGEYLKSKGVYKPRISSFNTQGEVCIFIWNTENNFNYTKSEVNIWELLEFMYSNLKTI